MTTNSPSGASCTSAPSRCRPAWSTAGWSTFPHHEYDTDYGLTESVGPGCVHLGIENVHKVGAIGKPGYQWETMIVDDSGAPVEQGAIGELAVKGPGVMKGYYNDPEATAAVLQATAGCSPATWPAMDEDGFIYLVDRKKDVIITGGENIYPVQIEDFLHRHPDVKDVAVIGLPDERLGEIAAAIVQLKRGHHRTEAEILEFCSPCPATSVRARIIFDRCRATPPARSTSRGSDASITWRAWSRPRRSIEDDMWSPCRRPRGHVTARSGL